MPYFATEVRDGDAPAARIEAAAAAAGGGGGDGGGGGSGGGGGGGAGVEERGGGGGGSGHRLLLDALINLVHGDRPRSPEIEVLRDHPRSSQIIPGVREITEIITRDHPRSLMAGATKTCPR